MKKNIGPYLLIGFLLGVQLSMAEIGIASLNSLGQPMAHGVCDTMAAVSDSGMTAFIAPMEDRADSRTNGFHASFLLDSGTVIPLYPGYLQALAQFLHVYSKTTNVRLAANRDFTAFAIIVEKIKSGSTPAGSDVTVPTSMGTYLAIVDAFGNTLQEIELSSSEGKVSASQCRVSFADDGRLLVVCGQYLGLRLFDTPTTDLMSFTTLDVIYKTGTAVITGDGSKVFFTQDGASQRSICYMDTMTGKAVDTGLTTSSSINDAQMAVNHDGSCVVFRKTSGSLSICSFEDASWEEAIIEGKHIRNPGISADGRYIVYQTHGTSYSQIMKYDRKKNMATLVSQNDNGVEADADCTSPSISPDGSRIAFVSSSSNLVANGNGQPQIYVAIQEKPSVTLNLKKGWNLCTLPFAPDEESIALVNGAGVHWWWLDGRFKQSKEFPVGLGFWLYAFTDSQLQLTGEEEPPVPLHRGWNFVLPSLYPEIASRLCFGLEGKSYIQLTNPMGATGAVWVFW